MPKLIDVVPGGQDLVAQVDEKLMAVVSSASEQVAQRVRAAVRSMK